MHMALARRIIKIDEKGMIIRMDFTVVAQVVCTVLQGVSSTASLLNVSEDWRRQGL